MDCVQKCMMCRCFCITGTVRVSVIAQKRPKGTLWIMELMLLSYGEHCYRMAVFLSEIGVRIGKETFVSISNLYRSFVVQSASSVACGGTARKMISLQPPQPSSPLYLFFWPSCVTCPVGAPCSHPLVKYS